MLTIGEQWLVLAINDKDGKVEGELRYALSSQLRAAELMELVVRGRLRGSRRSDSDDRLEFIVSDASPTGDEILDDALAEANRRLPGPIEEIFDRLAESEEPLLTRLVAGNVLRVEDHNRLGLSSRRYFMVDPAMKARMREGLSEALAGTAADVRTLGLAGLVNAGTSYPAKKLFFSKAELKRRYGHQALREASKVRRQGEGRAGEFFAPDVSAGDGAGPIGNEMSDTLEEIVWELASHTLSARP